MSDTSLLPKSVTVGHLVYSIHTDRSEILAEPDGDEAGARCGESFHASHQIWINTDSVAVEEIKDTLLHEILHCCIAASGLNWLLPRTKRQDIEEAYVSVLTFPLANVLRDNPAVTAYLFSST